MCVMKTPYDSILKVLEHDLKRCSDDRDRLSRSLERACEISGAERGFVLLRQPASDEMEVVAARGIDPQSLYTTAEISLSLIRHVLRSGRAVRSDNATVDPRFAETNSVILSGLRSVLCVPVKSGRKTTALIYLDNRLQAGVFTQDHLDVLQSIARKVSSRLSLPSPRLGARPVAKTRVAGRG
jgi:GAF domain-containing protein